ncbi:MAG: hypothetical protein DRJ65_19390 [Acidobacteria bacterium]|nr:MAG: hypothetical protein DRJ65_19390 [Acidobacteriota bacterium]
MFPKNGQAVACLSITFFVYTAEFLSFFQNNKEARYLVTPGSLLTSFARVGIEANRKPVGPETVVGADATPGPAVKGSERPVLFVFVLGESQRSRSLSINDYPRLTTPRLAERNVISFKNVLSSGTSTAEALPRIFSKFSRKGFDKNNGMVFENLLNVVSHAGFRVVWRDNNSGCKGLCDGFETERLNRSDDPNFCHDGNCYDEILLNGLDEIVAADVDTFLVLHLKGSHGPAYFRRYPPAFDVFRPACSNPDLSACTNEEIRNDRESAGTRLFPSCFG